MSIRAFKVIKIDTEKESTWDVSLNWDIVDILGIAEQFNETGGGLVCIWKATVESALIIEKNISIENKKILEAILVDIGDEKCIDYFCC